MIFSAASSSVKLGAAVLLAFAGIAWPVCAAMTQNSASGPGRVVTLSGGRAEPTPVPTPAPLSERESKVDETQDPFRPFDPEPTAPTTTVETKAPMPTTLPAPIGPLSPMPPSLPAASPTVAKAPVESVSDRLRLTGVVVGAEPTAVVAIGDGEIVVRPGDVLPDGSKLIAIERTHATFVRQGRKTVLWIAE